MENERTPEAALSSPDGVLHVRLLRRDLESIREAATLQGQTISQFARATMASAAREVIAAQQPLTVAPELARAILASMEFGDAV